MRHLAEAYNSAATALIAAAQELAADPENPAATAAALRTTLNILERLSEREPSAQTLAQLQRLATDFEAAGTISPDKVREIALAFNKIAQNYGEGTAHFNNIWS